MVAMMAMVVGAALVELHVHGSRSLKQKRGVIRSIVQRVRNRYNVSVAEVGGQDTWQRAVLGLALVGHRGGDVRRSLESVADFIEELHLAEVRNTDVEIMSLPHDDAYDDPHGNSPGDESAEPLPWEQD